MSSGCIASFDALRPGVAGFARYLPWDSVRVVVSEDSLRQNARILAYKFNPAVRKASFKGFASHSPHRPPLIFLPGCAVAARDRREAPLRRPASGSRRCRSCRRDAPRHRAFQPRLVGRARVRISRRAGRGPRVRPCACVWRPRVRAQCDRRASGDRDCDARLVRPLGAGARGPSLSVQFWLQQ